ncbi:YwpF-like family protein, partial [Acinetobacter baumannii]|nr:YwpF-like family protein [Acinetobacter baumannii]
MKTFRLIDLKIVRQDDTSKRLEEFPLIDGLIINKEDGENHWMVEGLVSKEYRYFFEYLLQEGKEVKAYVTITKKSNRPAQLLAKVKNITVLGEHVSVLLDGKMV